MSDGTRGDHVEAVAAIGEAQAFGEFLILEHLADGGMSRVYAAWQPSLDRTVALKLLKPELGEDPRLVEAFLRRDVQALASLEHPSITRVYASGIEDGKPYLVMELLEGGSLANPECRARYQDARQRLELIATLARAVQHSHARGVLHCDIKPSNVLFDEAGQPRLSDFGLSQSLGGNDHLSGGSWGWMAPEQVQADKPGDGTPVQTTVATDVFALGVLLFWLTNGSLPFGDGDDYPTRLREEQRAPPGRWSKSHDWAAAAVCHRALQVAPSDRYESAHALAVDIERALWGLPLAGVATPRWRRVWLWLGVHRTLAVLAAVLVVVLGVGSRLLVRTGENHERELLQQALEMQAFAARGQASHVLYQLRQTAEVLRKVATEPLIRSTARSGRGAPSDVSDDPAQHCSYNEPVLQIADSSPQIADFDVLQVLDPSGCPRARFPEAGAAYQYLWYGWRNYFRGAAEAAEQRETRVHVGSVFRSNITGEVRFSLSTPIYDSLSEGPAPIGAKWIGVASAGITVNSTLRPISGIATRDNRHVVAILGPFEGDNPNLPDQLGYTLLAHPALGRGEARLLHAHYANRLQEAFASVSNHEDEFALPDVEPITFDDYVDPFWGERWLAAFAPVGRTGYAVLVQTKVSSVVQPGVAFSQQLLLGLLGGSCVVLGCVGGAIWWDAKRRRQRAV